MATVYEEIIPTLITNAKVEKIIFNDVHNGYRIQANDGYVLHDSRIDEYEYDMMGNPVGNPILRFKLGSTTVNKNYDFTDVVNGTYTYTDENGMEITLNVEKIGEYDFYSITQAEYEEIEKAMLAEAMPPIAQ